MDNIKELRAKIKKVSGEEKVEAINHLAFALSNTKPVQSERYAIKALALAEKLDFIKGIARSYNIIGISCHRRSDFNKAMSAYTNALIIFNEIGDKHNIASTHNNIGAVYEIQGNYDQALRYYFEALRINEETKDKLNLAASYNNIGIVYEKQMSYDKALEYHFKAVEIREKNKDKNGLAVSYNNIGVIYEQQNNSELALEYLLKALTIKEKIGNKRSIAISYVNVGNIYKEQSKDAEAIEYFQKALETFENLPDKYGIAISCDSLGKIQTKLQQYDLAYEYIQRSIKLAKDIGAKEVEMSSTEALSELYEIQHDYENALKWSRKFTDIRNEIFSIQKKDEITKIKTIYEIEKKEKEAEIHRLKNVELKKQITERKKAENEIKKSRERLRKLAHYLQNVREIERHKITSGLYENLSQNLAALLMELDSINKGLTNKQKKEKQTIKSMYDLIEVTLQDLQKESHEIRPSHLDFLGLIPTIEWYAEAFKERTGILCKTKFEPEIIKIDKELSITLFRIIQEVLDNVHKHAKAKEVLISIEKQKGNLNMIISDDGIGITKKQLNDEKSLGLLNIKERILKHKGSINISGKRGKGTNVEANIPIRMKSK